MKTQPEELARALAYFYFTLDKFLVGLRLQAEVEFDPVEFRNAARLIRRSSRSAEVRITVAAIEGLMNTYAKVEVPGLRFVSSASADLVDNFNTLVTERYYEELASRSLLWGIPAKIGRSLSDCRRLVRAIVSESRLRGLVDVSTSIISAATSVPLPDSEIAESLVHSGYLPPAVSLRDPLASATKNWEEAKTEFIAHRERLPESSRPTRGLKRTSGDAA